MAFDAEKNLYVTRWCLPGPSCSGTGNTIEKFNVLGQSMGPWGTGYNCDPHAIVFDAVGRAWVGQAGCSRSLLTFERGAQFPTEIPVAGDFQGVFWLDLSADRCTAFYTSFGPNVKRYDVCGRRQLANFNAAPLPGGIAQDLRVLPDGGVLVSSGQVIARLNASGQVVQTFEIPGETALWAGLDLLDDGTFWAGNYSTSNVYRFQLATGSVVARFNSNTPQQTVVGIRVLK
jgi:streptogramin lyase